jgi:hypothetical protein
MASGVRVRHPFEFLAYLKDTFGHYAEMQQLESCGLK